MPVHHLLVGTFNTNLIATLAFDSTAGTLKVVAKNDGQAPHSWLALNVSSSRHRNLVRRRLTFDRPSAASFPIRKPKIDSTRRAGPNRLVLPVIESSENPPLPLRPFLTSILSEPPQDPVTSASLQLQPILLEDQLEKCSSCTGRREGFAKGENCRNWISSERRDRRTMEESWISVD
jgi:hypothetical protein